VSLVLIFLKLQVFLIFNSRVMSQALCTKEYIDRQSNQACNPQFLMMLECANNLFTDSKTDLCHYLTISNSLTAIGNLRGDKQE